MDTTTAPVGTTFRLQLAVYDRRGRSATAERIVAVVSPCAAGETYCEIPAEDGGEPTYLCTQLKCADAQQLAASLGAGGTGSAAPRLFLLPGMHQENLMQVS